MTKIMNAVRTLTESGLFDLCPIFGMGWDAIRPVVPDNQLDDWVADPVQWLALNYFQCDKDIVVEYVNSDGGRARCTAITRAGIRCKCLVAGQYGGRFDTFLAARGGYCALHGGSHE